MDVMTTISVGFPEDFQGHLAVPAIPALPQTDRPSAVFEGQSTQRNVNIGFNKFSRFRQVEPRHCVDILRSSRLPKKPIGFQSLPA
jgi:hypothetical protein